MEEITLQALLEAGCHFGHKAERWHPHAGKFIYTEKDGIHIIDLAQTKTGLEQAANYVKELVASGGEVLFVGTKRQAKGVVKEEVEAVGAPYFVERWIGGFMTNWESVKKNIDKINRLTQEQATGGWKKFPKHEQSKLTRYLAKLKVFYGGVLSLTAVPSALFVIDIRKEDAAVREGKRRELPIIAIVDTNADPAGIDYPIPANDDAVGSIQYIVHAIAQAYKEGKELHEKDAVETARQKDAQTVKQEESKIEVKEEKKEEKKEEVKTEKPKKSFKKTDK